MEERIKILLDKRQKGKCSEEELEELNSWYERVNLPSEALPADMDTYAEQKFSEFKSLKDKANRGKYAWFNIAAAILIALGIGAVVWSVLKQDATTVNQVASSDIQPGKTGAILTLSNGSTIVLDSAGNGTIARQGGVKVENINGQLAYNGKTNGPAIYNTLSTPKARQFQLQLPDGTKAWLNSASSILYPVSFTGKERKVEITGEVYFEVAHNSSMPFKVLAGNSEITDIGTHFNVYAYPEEPQLKTTLLEGAVKIGEKILKPGEQATISQDNSIRVVKLPDAEDVIAWKNGLINFNSEDFHTLMRQIGRWYNIDVKIDGNIPDYHMTGTIPRNMALSEVLEVLKTYGLKFQVNQSLRQLVVTAD